MKNKKTFWVFSITALVIAIIFVALKIYTLAAVIVIGAIIAGHREIWSLIRYRKMPPNDERVQENIDKSIRNSFLFFIVISLVTILLYITDEPVQPMIEYFLSGLLLSVSIVYVISYLFYDKIEANSGNKQLRLFRVFLLIAAISLLLFVIDAFFINRIISFNVHRALLYISALTFALGVIGSFIIFVRDYWSKLHK